VGNRNTWPNILDEMSGPGVQIFNLGVTGYSSVEHIAQTAWKLPALNIDIAIYYLGWNDIRNIGIPNLQADYSRFHARTLYQGLGFPDYVITGAKYSALLALLDKVLQELGVLRDFNKQLHKVETEGTFAEDIDKHTMDIFRANIRSIIGLAKAHNIVPVFVPQILNYERLTGTGSYGWMPRVRDGDVKKFMGIYNEEMRSISKEMRVTFIKAPLNWNWTDSDFVDQGHFSAKGNRIFGELILEALKKHGLLPE